METDFLQRIRDESSVGKGAQGSPEPSLRGPVDEKRQFPLCKFAGELVRQVVGWLNLRHSGPLTGVAVFHEGLYCSLAPLKPAPKT